MFDELTAGIDEILLSRLEVGRIEIPVESVSEMMQLRQKFYVRAKKIRQECEKSQTYGKLYTAASTFTATPDEDSMLLIINDRSHIVGTSAVKNALASVKKRMNGENVEVNKTTGDKLLDSFKEGIAKEGIEKAQPNPFYNRNEG